MGYMHLAFEASLFVTFSAAILKMRRDVIFWNKMEKFKIGQFDVSIFSTWWFSIIFAVLFTLVFMNRRFLKCYLCICGVLIPAQYCKIFAYLVHLCTHLFVMIVTLIGYFIKCIYGELRELPQSGFTYGCKVGKN